MQKPSSIYLLAVCGGICSGKSTVSHYLQARGAEAIDLDACAHDVLLHNTSCQQELIHCFGARILDEKGQISRTALAACAFADASVLAQLDKITHPYIQALFLKKICALSSTSAAVLQGTCESTCEGTGADPSAGTGASADALSSVREASPLKRLVLVEIPLPHKVPDILALADETIAVIAPASVRARFAQARGISLYELRRRLSYQPDDAYYAAHATQIITNDASRQELEQQLDAWLQKRLRSHAFRLSS